MLGSEKINGVSSRRRYLVAAVVAAVLALVSFVGARAEADPRPGLYLLPQAARYPEGITAENSTGTFYVSSATDGSIYRGNVSEKRARLFLPGGEDGRRQSIGMKLDDGRLYVAGGQTAKAFVYDTSDGDLIRSFDAKGAGLLNDLAIDQHSGDTFITDSFVPILWRVPADAVTNSTTPGEIEPWLDLRGTSIQYATGFNLNGIVATPDGRYLLTVQTNTGNLYRIDVQTKQVTQVDLGGAKLTNGDGLVLRGHTLYAIRNQEIVTEVSLDGQFASGRVVGSTSKPSLDFSTTGALVHGRLLVVNSQFDEGGPLCPDVKVCPEGEPEIPFTISSMRAP